MSFVKKKKKFRAKNILTARLRKIDLHVCKNLPKLYFFLIAECAFEEIYIENKKWIK